MRRNGIVIKNFITLFIAAIGIVLIIGFFSKGYADIKAGQEVEQAQEKINELKDLIDSMDDGSRTDRTISGLQNWFLGGWDKLESNTPDQCGIQSCICICRNVEAEESEKTCKGGVCRKFDKTKINVFENSNLEGIDLGKSSFVKLIVEKEEDMIKISADFGKGE